ncbi:winged helix-turn-helix transcriptional regulator [Metallosphaera tengchongensis]|uniref:Winged helix-turn-helix transcriptional regulator n=1 Tax=Metallosphaera tengchongensis TaxID=1532350 RepID=A0A6N0NUY0_9CREN|nr:winged helix-turn-helix domain-containing protein [Metallosphaera tengchongensis]QKQ99984.1 winged helix-turn-helix transcriptional regulator [Metallosphaera tengchongensis]
MDLIVSDVEDIIKISEALSSMTRVNILKLIANEEKSITELSEELHMTKGNVSSQVALLVSSGLVEVRYTEGNKGLKKLIRSKYSKIVISLLSDDSLQEPGK